MKAVDLLTRALRAVGNVGAGETPDADDINTALLALNDMLDSWSVSRLFIYQLLEENFPLVGNKGVYSIGPGGDFNTIRPTQIDSAFVRLNGFDYPIDEINNDAYSSITYKSLGSGFPEQLYYNPTVPTGEINLWPLPQNGMALYIQTPKQLSQFPDLTTDITLPPGYAEAIRYAVMPRLAAEGLGTLSAEQAKLSQAADERIKTLNSSVPVLSPDFPTGGHFNILKGD